MGDARPAPDVDVSPLPVLRRLGPCGKACTVRTGGTVALPPWKVDGMSTSSRGRLPHVIDEEAASYISEGHLQVPGWFKPLDAAAFCAVDRSQVGAKGDLLEIGVYLGKSAVLLGFMVRPGEQLVVCDLFEDLPGAVEDIHARDRHYAGLARSRFEANYLSFHGTLPEIIQQDSTELELPEHTFRFIHVDGSHRYDVVRQDVALTRRLLLPGGVVCFDDITAFHAPGVAAAVWEAVAVDGLRPLALTPKKMYATWGDEVALDVVGIARQLGLDVHCEQHVIRGYPVARFEAVAEEVRAKRLMLDVLNTDAVRALVRGVNRRAYGNLEALLARHSRSGGQRHST
jgi:predicted O-methyltransferase YrrM